MAGTNTYGVPTKYSKKPLSIAEYAMMRGVTDFTNAAQFNLYEGGYQYLFVLSVPKYIDMLAGKDPEVARLLNAFCNIMEQEFKGASGFEDISTEDLEVTDGISTLNVLGKVTKQSTAEISMTFTEKSGAVITNFIKYYLEGIRDPRTLAKTYHGLIKNGDLYPGFENEVFTLLYIVTDNTLLMLEKAFLLCNAYPTTSKQSIYEGEKGNVEKKDIDVSWRCFIVDGEEVDKRAIRMLARINETDAVSNAYKAMKEAGSEMAESMTVAQSQKAHETGDRQVTLDYNTYQYNILNKVDNTLEKETT